MSLLGERIPAMLPAHTYVPGEGPSGVLPVRKIGTPAIPPPIGSGKAMGTNKPYNPGEGYISGLRTKVAGMDVVNGMDRTMGKTQTIKLGKRISQNKKIQGNLSSKQALGRLSGALGRNYDGIA